MAAFTAVEIYRPIEEAKYGDIVCVDPRRPGVKNDARWVFLTRDEDILTLMILSVYAWGGVITTVPGAQEFVVVRP